MNFNRIKREKNFHDSRFYEKDIRESVEKYYIIAEEAFRCFRYKVLKECSGKKLLDYGCGTGNLSILCSRKGAEVVSIDLSEMAILLMGSLKTRHFCSAKVLWGLKGCVG